MPDNKIGKNENITDEKLNSLLKFKFGQNEEVAILTQLLEQSWTNQEILARIYAKLHDVEYEEAKMLIQELNEAHNDAIERWLLNR